MKIDPKTLAGNGGKVIAAIAYERSARGSTLAGFLSPYAIDLTSWLNGQPSNCQTQSGNG